MRQAYTLLEVIIVLTLVAILSAVVIPRSGDLLDGIRVHGAASEVESIFHTARQSAILRSQNAVLEIDTVGGIVTIRSGSDTITRREIGAVHGVHLSATRTNATYSPIGLGYGASNLTLIIKRNAKADTLTISRLGRVKR